MSFVSHPLDLSRSLDGVYCSEFFLDAYNDAEQLLSGERSRPEQLEGRLAGGASPPRPVPP